MNQLPAELGFFMPAEWMPHEATWIAWPHNRSDWPGKFPAIPWVYTEIVRHLHYAERVRILVADRKEEQKASRLLQRAGVDLERIDFFRIPTNRVWTRDCGPTFLKQVSGSATDPSPPTPLPSGERGERQKPSPRWGEGGRRPGEGSSHSKALGPSQNVAIATRALLDWRFNAWAKYPDWRRDDAVPAKLSKLLDLRAWQPQLFGQRIVLEGGSIDVNGEGLLLTTEECLRSDVQERNPGLTAQDYEQVFAEYLGVKKVLWLGRGIAGDDTHGHIDDLARFVGPRTIAVVVEDDPADANYEPLQENLERLRGMRDLEDRRFEVVPLPMPAPLYFAGQRLPASFANFYIANDRVLVPTFNDPNDRLALGILADLFPDRAIVGIHAVDLVWGLGTLHCLTQQEIVPSDA